MSKKLVLSLLALSILTGCTSVPLDSAEKTAMAKKFNPPSDDKAGIYIFRSGHFGAALRKDLWIDGKCIGESAPNVFFYEEVKGNADYTLTTSSEFSPNDLMLRVEAGKNYFVRQFIKLGLFIHGADLEVVDDEEGKREISALKMASKGTCSH